MAKLRCIFDRHVMLPPHFRWNDAISSFCGKEAFAFLADRFGYLNQFTRINAAAISEGKLPSFASTIDFSTCMGSRAAELLARCERDGCHCYVLWSGGCDSTGVLSALISVGFPRGMLTVLYTKSSLEENPEFFSFIQSLGFAVELVTARTMFTVALSYASRGDIVLTGFPADQLFGVAGQLAGGRLSDKYGRKRMLVLGLVLAIPCFMLIFTNGAVMIFGIMSYAFFASFCYVTSVTMTQELLPGKTGLASGLTLGFTMGIGGLGAAVVGLVADATGNLSGALSLMIIPVVIAPLIALLVKYKKADEAAVLHP